jgi:hypothetical protein
MASSGMLRRVALVSADVSEELSASFIWVTRIGELETLAVTSNLVRTDVSEEPSVSTIRVTRIGELETMLAVNRNRRLFVPSSPILVTLMKEALSSSGTSVLTRATRR